jgi:hypothetical protein
MLHATTPRAVPGHQLAAAAGCDNLDSQATGGERSPRLHCGPQRHLGSTGACQSVGGRGPLTLRAWHGTPSCCRA